MAIEFNIDADKRWFLGEDKILSFKISDASGNPLDVSAWQMEFIVRKTDKAADPPVIPRKATPTDIVISGIFNSNPDQNQQRVVITFDSDETSSLKPITYRYSLKRIDTGNEGILAYGGITFLQATAH